MITHLHGRLESKNPTHIILDVGGVGYEVLIPLSSYDKLPSEGETCKVLTFDYLREDQHSLYGFLTDNEREMFRHLMTISGIGPKLAISALSGLTVKELATAIVEGNVKRLSSISGVGKKVAERMIVELRDKLEGSQVMGGVPGAGMLPEDLKLRDAALALAALGYKEADAVKMVRRVVESGHAADSVEDLIRLALAK
jgi:Holliday junction DNA helicase RuvA